MVRYGAPGVYSRKGDLNSEYICHVVGCITCVVATMAQLVVEWVQNYCSGVLIKFDCCLVIFSIHDCACFQSNYAKLFCKVSQKASQWSH